MVAEWLNDNIRSGVIDTGIEKSLIWTQKLKLLHITTFHRRFNDWVNFTYSPNLSLPSQSYDWPSPMFAKYYILYSTHMPPFLVFITKKRIRSTVLRIWLHLVRGLQQSVPSVCGAGAFNPLITPNFRPCIGLIVTHHLSNSLLQFSISDKGITIIIVFASSASNNPDKNAITCIVLPKL